MNRITNKFGHIRRVKRLAIRAGVTAMANNGVICHGGHSGAYCEPLDAPNVPKLICNLVYMSVGKLVLVWSDANAQFFLF